MNTFDYLRGDSTPQKKTQSGLAKISSFVDRKLTQKILDFINRI